MSIGLEERLRRAAELLDERANYPATMAVGRPDQAAERTNALVRVAAALVVVVGLAGVTWAIARDSGSATRVDEQPATSGAATPTVSTPAPLVERENAVAPVATLPASDDLSVQVPPTVVANRPIDWYRLQPDLDVAWYSDPAGTASMLCFRTPSISECLPDDFAPTRLGGGPIAVQGADNQFLIVTLDPVDTVTVTLDDGTATSAPTELDDGVGWRVARITVAADRSPVGMSMFFDGDT